MIKTYLGSILSLSIALSLSGFGIVSDITNSATAGDDICLTLEDIAAHPGDNVCMPLTVTNFNDISELDFSISVNPSELLLTDFINRSSLLIQSSLSPNGGTASFEWGNGTQSISLADGTVLAELCFTVLATDDFADVDFSDVHTIRDGNGELVNPNLADGTVIVSADDCPSGFTLSLSAAEGQIGEEICLQMAVENFENIIGLQFSVDYDPNHLAFMDTRNQLSLTSSPTPSFLQISNLQSGTLTGTWNDPQATGVTLAEGTGLLELCFTILGTDVSTPTFSNSLTRIEVTDNQENSVPFNGIDGQIRTVGGNGNILNLSAPWRISREFEEVCLPVTVSQFTDLQLVQLGFDYDSEHLSFQRINRTNAALPGLSAVNIDIPTPGKLQFNWLTPNGSGHSLPNGSILFEACFQTSEGHQVSVFTTDGSAEVLNENSQSLSVGYAQPTIVSYNCPISAATSVLVDDRINYQTCEICTPIYVDSFIDIARMSFPITYEEELLTFTQVRRITNRIPNFSADNITNAVSGQVVVGWIDSDGLGITLPNGTELFDVCYEISGTADQGQYQTSDGVIRNRLNNILEFVADQGTINVRNATSPDDLMLTLESSEIDAEGNFCVSINTTNFTDILGMQFSINYAADTLNFVSFQNQRQFETDPPSTFLAANPQAGNLTFAWSDFDLVGQSLNNGDALVDACFQFADGISPCLSTTLALSCTPTAMEIVNGNDNIVNLSPTTLTINENTERPDLAPLLALYNSTDGPNWINNTGWAAGAAGESCDPCNYNGNPWYGIGCTAVGDITYIDLDGLPNGAFNSAGGNGLEGILPGNLGDIATLLGLYFAENRLTGSIPAELGQLTELEFLYLTRNNFNDTIPATLGNLNNLISLYIDENQLQGPIPNSLGTLDNLQFLYLNDNFTEDGAGLSGAVPTTLGTTTTLEGIGLQGNRLTDTLSADLFRLPILEFLSLAENNISGTLPDAVASTNLGNLSLADNNLSGCIPESWSILCDRGANVILSNNPGLLTTDFDAYCQDEEGSCRLTNCDRNRDSLALVSLYNATNGAGWIRNDNWLTSTPLEQWYGITTNGACVTEINLELNDLVGTIPSEIGDISRLINLRLNSNQIGGPIPNEIGQLTQLELLYLSSNQLSGSIPNEVGQLSNLRFLHLSANSLTDTIPDEIGQLTNLELLLLYNNELSGPIPNELGNIVGLNRLRLNDNNLDGAIPEELENLIALTDIQLQDNQLSGCIPTGLLDIACNLNPAPSPQEQGYNFSNNPSLPWQGDIGIYCQGGTQEGATCDDGDEETTDDRIQTISCECLGVTCPTGTTILVTNDADSGEGSLRQAIECANANPLLDTILLTESAFGANPTSPLPAITDNGIYLSGLEYRDTFQYFVIWRYGLTIQNTEDVTIQGIAVSSAESMHAITVDGSSNVTIAYNSIAFSENEFNGIHTINSSTNINLIGNNIVGNDGHGVYMSGTDGLYMEENTISSSNQYELYLEYCNGGTLISNRYSDLSNVGVSGSVYIGNSSAIDFGTTTGNWVNNTLADAIELVDAIDIRIQNNYIGTNEWGNNRSGSGIGINVSNSERVSINNNTIAYQASGGILFDTGSNDCSASQNSLFCNDNFGISLAAGVNSSASVPIISNATTTAIVGTAATAVRVEVFRVQRESCPENTVCQGYEFLGEAFANANGDWTLNPTTTVNTDDEVLAIAFSPDEGASSAQSDCVVVAAGCDHPDLAALRIFYIDTNGPSWDNNEGWAAGASGESCDPCNYNGSPWYGILCTNGRVTCLDLDGGPTIGDTDGNGNGLSGTLTPFLTGLTQLEKIILSENALTGSLPEAWFAFANLEWLILDRNELTGGLPASWSALTNLEWMALNANRLTGNLPETWSALPSIESIDVGINNLDGSLPVSWSAMTTLRGLGLYGNRFSGNLPDSWRNLTNLVSINCFSNDLSGLLPASWSALANLQFVSLVANNFSGSLPASWANLTQLERLYLRDNNLSGCYPESWRVLCDRLPYDSDGDLPQGYNFDNNTLLPWQGDMRPFCAEEEQDGVDCAGFFGTNDLSDGFIAPNCECLPSNFIDFFNIENTSCPGASDGSISLRTIPDSAGVYSFSWSTDSNLDAPTISNLAAGSVSVTVTHVRTNLTNTASFEVRSNSTLELSVTDIDNNLCADGSAGVIVVEPLSGTAPFSFDWSTGQQTSSGTLSNLPSASYNVTVSDAFGCSEVLSNIQVNDLTPPLAVDDQTVNDTEDPGNSGSIQLTPMGGTPTYRYQWSTGQQSSFIINLAAGNYSVTITDDNECMEVINYTISQLQEEAMITPTDCTDGNSGSIAIIPNSGTQPYTYEWRDESGRLLGVDSLLDNLAAGTYFLTLQDASGAILLRQYDIDQVDNPITVDLTPTLCLNEELEVNGNTYNAQMPTGTEIVMGGASNGCDSIIEVQLRFFPPATAPLDTVLCTGTNLVLGGTTYTEAVNNLEISLAAASANGCDSTIILSLAFADTIRTTQSASICSGDAYDFGGALLEQAGQYTQSLQTATGCDSLVILDLVVSPMPFTTIDSTICTGESINFCGQLIEQEGEYPCTFTNVEGCDSTVVLQLLHRETPDLAAVNDVFSLSRLVMEADLAVTDNDTIGRNDSLVLVSLPFHGDLALSEDRRSIRYTLTDVTAEQDSFQYALCTAACTTVCDTAWVSLKIIKNCWQELLVLAPTAFSPNNDGINDVFDPVTFLNPDCEYDLDQVKLTVINRASEVVFQAQPYLPWNGETPTGKPLPADSYLYFIEYEDERVQAPILLIR